VLTSHDKFSAEVRVQTVLSNIRAALRDAHTKARATIQLEPWSPERREAQCLQRVAHAETEALQQDAKAALAKLNGPAPSVQPLWLTGRANDKAGITPGPHASRLGGGTMSAVTY
jgi:hypothetical protein